MKKYTTLLCLLLALVMVMACFTGCAKQPAQSDPADTTEPAQTTDTTPEDSTPAEPADTRETVNIRFAQFGNNLDDLDGYANDPIKAAIEQAVGVTLEYDTGTDGFDDRMQTELFTGSAPDLFPTWGESDKIASWVQDGLVTNLGEIVNADPDRYPTLYKMMNSEEWKAYNKLYTGDETASYAIYSVAAFADPSFGGVPVYNQAILDEVNEGKVPATVDEFLTYCEAAGSAGYVGWWPRNDKLTNWNEIDATLALPQGTSITVPKGAGTGTILSGEAGTDSEYWTVSAVSEQSKAVVKQLAELYKNGGLDANIGVKGDFDVAAIAALLQARCERLTDIPEKVDFFDACPEYDVEFFTNKKSKTNPEVCKAMLEAAIPMLAALPRWTDEAIHDGLIALAEQLGVKNATLMWPVRIAAAGKLVTPGGAVEICRILGRDETLRRLRAGLEKLA